MRDRSLSRSRGLFETREKVIEVLEVLAEHLDARVYLFGSYARGDHMLESDVDIIVVSRIFAGMSTAERVALVRRMLPETLSFDIIALTPEEFERMSSKPLFRDASRYWILVEPRRGGQHETREEVKRREDYATRDTLHA